MWIHSEMRTWHDKNIQFPSFVSFAIFKTVSKVKEKDVLVRSSGNLKSFLNGRFTFLIYLLKNCFFFLSYTYTQVPLLAQGYFFHCLSTFSGFSLQLNPHSKNPFLILGNTKFHNWFYICIITSLKSTIIDTTVSLSRLFLLL